jgi:FkbM family methyltransferase
MESFYRQFVRQGDLVFDVGAYHGSRTMVFRTLGARVVAVEPVKESVRVLFARFGADPLVTVISRALGEADASGEIVLSAPHLFSSSLSAEYRRAGLACGRYPAYGVSSWQETRAVRITTMDTLIDRFGVPSFAKIDVEGYEPAVLAGLSQPLPALSFEFHPHLLDFAARSIDRLQQLGAWKMNLVIGEECQFQLDTWISPREMIGALNGMVPRQDVMYGDVYARRID